MTDFTDIIPADLLPDAVREYDRLFGDGTFGRAMASIPCDVGQEQIYVAHITDAAIAAALELAEQYREAGAAWQRVAADWHHEFVKWNAILQARLNIASELAASLMVCGNCKRFNKCDMARIQHRDVSCRFTPSRWQHYEEAVS